MAKLYIYPLSPVTVDTGPLATSANQLLEIAQLQDVNTELNTQTTALNTIAATDFALESKQDTQITALNSSNTKLDTLIAKDYATTAKQDAQTAILQNIEAATILVAADTEDIKIATQALNSKTSAALFTLPYNNLLVVSKTADGPTQIVSRTGVTIIQTLNITYNAGDFESATVS